MFMFRMVVLLSVFGGLCFGFRVLGLFLGFRFYVFCCFWCGGEGTATSLKPDSARAQLRVQGLSKGLISLRAS